VKRPGAEILDTTLWPSTDFSVLETPARERYQDRAAAIEFYSSGLPIGEVEERTRVDRRTLYRMIERALRRHPDGRPWGFRALIPSLRTVAYERRKTSNGKGRGLSGSFGQLLDRHRELEGLLRELIQNREVLLMQRGDRFYVKGLNVAHTRFTGVCRSLGLTARDYPLNQEEQGRRSLGNTLRSRMLQGFAGATRSAGSERIKPAAALKWGRAKARERSIPGAG
jgi:putative transposase